MAKKSKRDGGREYDDPIVKKRLMHALRSGADVTLACMYAGISRGTYYAWRRAAKKDPESRDGKFVRAIEGAKGEAAIDCLLLIKGAAETGSWQAAAWFLERAYPHLYGRGIDRAAAAESMAAEEQRLVVGAPDKELTTDAAILAEIKLVNSGEA